MSVFTRPVIRLALGLAVVCGMGDGHIASSAQQPPPFRATTEVVSVDVVVTGPDGPPVRGPTVEDFVMRHDGALGLAGADEIGLSTDGRHRLRAQQGSGGRIWTGSRQ